MLSITRRDGEAIQIGSTRLTWMSQRARFAEVLINRKSSVHYVQLRENQREQIMVDGHECTIIWNKHVQNGRQQYRIHIDAPRFVPIHRAELLAATPA